VSIRTIASGHVQLQQLCFQFPDLSARLQQLVQKNVTLLGMEVVTSEVQGIVAPEIWEQCNQILNQTYEKQKRPTKKTVQIFAGLAHCHCGEKMYVPSNSPKYVCRKCRNKIAIVDLEGIFCDQIKGYSFSTDRIAEYLKQADGTISEKTRMLELQKAELQKTEGEIARVYRLYQDGQLDSTGFGSFYRPLEERKKQVEADIPRLEAQLDLCQVGALSAEQIVTEAQNLHQMWPKMPVDDKRKIVEAITEKIVIGKDEIDITLCYLPTCKDMAKEWRKGEDSNL
jgi:site-specific DNA recombinase